MRTMERKKKGLGSPGLYRERAREGRTDCKEKERVAAARLLKGRPSSKDRKRRIPRNEDKEERLPTYRD